MALVTPSELFSNIKGSIGSTTFSTNRAGLIAKRKVTGHKNYTKKQANIIKIQSYVSGQWQNLTLVQQELWNDYADLYTQVDKFGVEKSLSGFNWFVHMNNINYALNETIIDEPPAREAAETIPSYEGVISSELMYIQMSEEIDFANHELYIFASLPKQQTNKTNRGNLRLIKTITDPNFTILDIKEDYESAFNVVWEDITNNSSFTVQFFIYSVNTNSFQNSVGVWDVSKLNEIPLDPDAQAYIDAAELTNPIEIDAINKHVVLLKLANVYDRAVLIHPFRGSSASACKWNLVNPVDSDAAHRVDWSGGWSYGITGAIPNGINAYADPHFNPSTDITAYKATVFRYSQSNFVSGSALEGCYDGTTGLAFDVSTARIYNSDIAEYIGYSPTLYGNMINRRSDDADMELVINDVSIGTNTNTVSNGYPSLNYLYGAFNNIGTPAFYTGQPLSYYGIFDNVSDIEALVISNIIDILMDDLGISV